MLTLFTCTCKSLQSYLTQCDPIDGSPLGSPVPGILQARTLEWGAISFSNAWRWKVKVKSLSHVRLSATPWTTAYQAPLSRGFSSKNTGVGCHRLLRHVQIISVKVKCVSQPCLTLCYPVDCSPPGSFVHGILQARILGWVDIPFSRGSSWPRDQTRVSNIAGIFLTVWATTEHSTHKLL